MICRLEATLIDPEPLAFEWLNCPMFHPPLQRNSLVGEGGIWEKSKTHLGSLGLIDAQNTRRAVSRQKEETQRELWSLGLWINVLLVLDFSHLKWSAPSSHPNKAWNFVALEGPFAFAALKAQRPWGEPIFSMGQSRTPQPYEVTEKSKVLLTHVTWPSQTSYCHPAVKETSPKLVRDGTWCGWKRLLQLIATANLSIKSATFVEVNSKKGYKNDQQANSSKGWWRVIFMVQVQHPSTFKVQHPTPFWRFHVKQPGQTMAEHDMVHIITKLSELPRSGFCRVGWCWMADFWPMPPCHGPSWALESSWIMAISWQVPTSRDRWAWCGGEQSAWAADSSAFVQHLSRTNGRSWNFEALCWMRLIFWFNPGANYDFVDDFFHTDHRETDRDGDTCA